ncbi:MAG: DegV family protein [Clostridia bacterium]|nr:DegV family protein [Clostridia bacterium]
MSVRIVIDSACDLPKSTADQLGLVYMPMRTIIGQREYLDGIELTGAQFYEKLIETDETPKTSQIPPSDFEAVFEEAVEAGDTVLCITVSSGLSGTYQSAMIAARRFGDRVFVVDSLNVTVGEQLLVLRAVQLRSEGWNAWEMAEILNHEKQRIRLIALLDTLEYLKKGGRISSTVAFAGALLSIKPVVALVDGQIEMLGKARGSKNGSNKLMELVKSSRGIDFDRPFMLAYSGLSDHLLRKYISDSHELYEGKTDHLPVCMIGSTIGAHAGPGAIGVAFFENE